MSAGPGCPERGSEAKGSVEGSVSHVSCGPCLGVLRSSAPVRRVLRRADPDDRKKQVWVGGMPGCGFASETGFHQEKPSPDRSAPGSRVCVSAERERCAQSAVARTQVNQGQGFCLFWVPGVCVWPFPWKFPQGTTSWKARPGTRDPEPDALTSAAVVQVVRKRIPRALSDRADRCLRLRSGHARRPGRQPVQTPTVTNLLHAVRLPRQRLLHLFHLARHNHAPAAGGAAWFSELPTPVEHRASNSAKKSGPLSGSDDDL